MYFPYLRGKQYELSALRDLLIDNKLGNEIVPIIEPEKMTLALLKTMEVFRDKKHPIAVVYNPQGRAFFQELQRNDDKITIKLRKNFENNDNIIKAYIMNENICQEIKSNPCKSDFMIVNDNRECLDFYLEAYDNESEQPKYVLMPDERSFKRIIKGMRIILEDNFNKKIRNADYAQTVDELFSYTHLDYRDVGYSGFSDYSIIGKDLSLSGFAPRAVVIHIVYFDNKNELRIHHFVSDTNDGIENPAGKFYEAVSKLKKWCDENNITRTTGLAGFYDCIQNGRYPGLGMVKKFSIMHHLELMHNYLGGIQ